MNLNQVTMSVVDMNAALNFYECLGFKLIVKTPHYVRFACPEGGASFSLVLAENAGGSSTIYFEHENLDQWVEKLINKGVVFEYLPKDQSYLWREALLLDPSKNKIKLYWAGVNRLNPPWKV